MNQLRIDERRVRALREAPPAEGPVACLMCRDQRVTDNWALLFAQQRALDLKRPMIVIGAPKLDYPRISRRQLAFSLEGLKQVETELQKLNITFFLSDVDKPSELLKLIGMIQPGLLVTDFSPLRESRAWKSSLADKAVLPLYEVDAHNIVPAWIASPKQEYAAYTFRPKINRHIKELLTGFPQLKKHPYAVSTPVPRLSRGLTPAYDSALSDPVSLPGEKRAKATLNTFLKKRLPDYHQYRNDASMKVQSDLSPYLHFGQISSQRVAIETQLRATDIKSQEAFLEELIVRRELADNFCLYNESYDSFAGFPAWARGSLDEHRSDPRPYLYSPNQLERAQTHDELWNAAQTEMVTRGKMHGYMRMYWAKKILEWTISPEKALDTAIYLNDKYELDGCDPNGYTGIAWSIGGVHDRPWFEHEIFGKVRYMSYSGANRKFDIVTYINRHKTGAAG
ncbi:MAG: deoxyribodipyrimidine photo-lyase [Candidatus Zixiibacteriota bacterium]